MTDTEAQYIREYLDENPKHLRAAFAVARAWPAAMHGVCRRFLEHLRGRVEKRVRNEFPKIADDLEIGCNYVGDSGDSKHLNVYRNGWMRYEGGWSPVGERTAVLLDCSSKGPTNWRWGVCSGKSKGQMTEAERERRERVEGALKQCGLAKPNDRWWAHLDSPRYRDWSVIVPELVQELADGGGKITDHYVDGLLKIAGKAIPAIDKVELEDMSASDSGNS